MKVLARLVIAIGATALLAGCGRLQPSIAAPGAMPQNRALVVRGDSANYKILYDFGGKPDGAVPESSLLNVGGTLYGTTLRAGALKDGCVFTLTKTGTEHVLYSFTARSNGQDGAYPFAGLIDVKGTLYGTTERGGTYRKGTVFAISTTGGEHVIYSFGSGSDGVHPVASLIDVKGTLYGTTAGGGTYGQGTVFAVSTSGAEHVVYSFGPTPDGNEPQASLIEVKGTLYGTTHWGGAYKGNGAGAGTVFSVTPNGSEHVLHSFGSGSDGTGVDAGLVAVHGVLYGTTVSGGIYSCQQLGCGTVFSITPSGTYKVVHSFNGTDGQTPFATLIDANGTLYGTTAGGGTYDEGTAFSVIASGMENVLYSFGSPRDGYNPSQSLIDVGGTLYGTTPYKGKYHHGTVFALSR